jgi:hypothetical protein
VVISDGGSHFTNGNLRKYLKPQRVEHRVATPYHPQTSGQVETSNKQIKNILQKTIHEMGRIWKEKLPEALWAYRITYKTHIGMTPYQSAYGKTCHLPVELEYKSHWAIKKWRMDLPTAGKKRQMQLGELEEWREKAYHNAKMYKEKTKRWHDKRIKKKSFKPGDKVLLIKLFGRGKLRNKWDGPFMVLNAASHGTVTLQDSDGNTFKANGQRLKIVLEPNMPNLNEFDVIEVINLD